MAPYLMIIPALIAIGFVHLYPSVRSIIMSFFDINLIKPNEPFVGMRNYVSFFQDKTNLILLINTLFWAVSSVFISMAISILIAVQLNKPFRGRGVLRATFLAPWVTPPVVISMIWIQIFSRDRSPINGLLMKLGITKAPIAFLADPTLHFGFLSKPMMYLILVNVWTILPFAIVMILSGLQTIPTELYEAAVIDGASKTKQFRFITFPLLMPVIEIVILLLFIWQFNSFNLNWMITNGGPMRTTEVMAVRIYLTAMQHYNYGYASAISVIMTLIVLVPAIFYIRRVTKEEFIGSD